MQVQKHKDFIESFNNAVYCITAKLGDKTFIRFRSSKFAMAGIERELGNKAVRFAGDVFQIEIPQGF
jgi:hypothetical protein